MEREVTPATLVLQALETKETNASLSGCKWIGFKIMKTQASDCMKLCKLFHSGSVGRLFFFFRNVIFCSHVVAPVIQFVSVVLDITKYLLQCGTVSNAAKWTLADGCCFLVGLWLLSCYTLLC